MRLRYALQTRRARVQLGALLCLVLVLARGAGAGFASSSATDPVIAVAGDIACASAPVTSGSSCHYGSTANLIANDPSITAVLAVGDLQYECGEYVRFRNYYDPSWGRFKGITHPALGNHEYQTYPGTSACDHSATTATTGYFDYWDGLGSSTGPAGDRSKGYYSFDLGSWHLVALNSNCAKVSCGTGSAQETWLKRDLAAHPVSCILAYMHHPRFASGSGATSSVEPLWADLYDAGADLVLAGHEHFYERFARLGRDGTTAGGSHPKLDDAGMREIIVGTGGRSLFGFGTIQSGSEARNSSTYGILKLTLHPGSYDWKFVPEPGKTFSDARSDTCTTTADTQAPTAPANLTAIASAATRVDLAWSPSSDNVGVTGYEVFRGPAGGTLAKIATVGAVTSYSDTTVAAATAYAYQVRALDAAGNESPASNTATVTTPAGTSQTTLTFAAAADATVKESSAGSNYGTITTLKADGGTGTHVAAYLRFAVTGIPVGQTVQSATLRLYVPSDGTTAGPGVYGVTDSSWGEQTITWSNRPAAATTATAQLGAIAAGTWAEYPVTPLVIGDGTYSFAVGPSATDDGVVFNAREAGSNTPQLVVKTG